MNNNAKEVAFYTKLNVNQHVFGANQMNFLPPARKGVKFITFCHSSG